MKLAIPTAFAALLCATIPIVAQAQDRPDRRKQEPAQRAAPAAREMRQSQPRVQQPRVQRSERAVERRIDRTPQRAQNIEGARRQQTERRERAETRERATRNTETRRLERQQRVERQKPQSPVERMSPTEPQVDRRTSSGRTEERRNTVGQVRESRNPQRSEAAREERARLTAEQRTRFHNSFDRRRTSNVRFSSRIGQRIPRSVRLYAIPAAVIGLVPAYSYYRYVYLDDTISVVDPDTYEVVDVIDYGSGGADVREAGLDLTADERALLLGSIPIDFPDTGLRLSLALGAEIPSRVELHAFPDVVLDQVPELNAYRFVVSDGDVVIVDPSDREIALVVRR